MLALLIVLPIFILSELLITSLIKHYTQLRGFLLIGVSLIAWLITLIWASFVASWAFGFETGTWILLLFLIVSTAGLLLASKLKIRKRQIHVHSVVIELAHIIIKKLYRNDELLIIVLICLLIGLLFHSRLLPQINETWYSGGSTWGDLAYHSAVISHFAKHDVVSFTNPIYSGAPNVYPFLFDFYTAWLVRAGFSLREALLLSSWQALISLAVLFVALCSMLHLRRVGSIASTAWFFLAGGLGFVFILKDKVSSGMSWLNFLQHLPVQYTNDLERGIYFSTPITDLLLPQRGLLVGLCVVIAILLLLGSWMDKRQHSILIVAAIMCGFLPLIHVHLFLACLGFFVLSIILSVRSRSDALVWVAVITIVGVIASAQWWWLLSNGQGSTFVEVDTWWMFDPDGTTSMWDYVTFFLLNFSLVFPIALLSFKVLPSREKSALWNVLFLGMLGILVLTLMVRFQPNPYDNTKFLIVALLSASMLAGKVIDEWWNNAQWLVVMLIITGTASGGLSILREFNHQYPMVAKEDLQELSGINQLLPSDAILASAPDHHFFLNMFGGYAVYLGYPGWLWTHGIEYAERATTLRNAYAFDTNAIRRLKQVGVTHVVLSGTERTTYSVDNRWYLQPNVYKSDGITIIDLDDVMLEF